MFKIYEAEDILPGFSRSSSERSSSSTGASVMSKSLHAAPSRLEGVNSMWQDLNDYLDLNSDTSLWDLDGGSQKMSDLVIGKKLHAPEQLTMTDTINPYAPLFNSQAHNASLQLNSTIASETSGSSNPRFKTEICRNFKEKGTCLYGDLCQFAHGKNELRKDVVRHNKYKTKHCQKYWINGYCAYGPRCNFIHKEQETQRATNLSGLSEPAVRTGSMPPTMFKTAAQVFGLASMRKASLEAAGESSSSEEGWQSLRGAGGHFDIHQYVRPREELALGLDKFPSFYPRNFQGGADPNPNMGPIGSDRPGRLRQFAI